MRTRLTTKRGAIVRWASALTAIAVGFGGVGLLSVLRPVERTAVLYVTPHPDDEYQYWSLLEDDETYDVIVLLTRGEETQFCDPEPLAVGWQIEHEPAPVPVPEGKWTESCAEARVHSLVRFLADMSDADGSVPGELGAATIAGPYDDPADVVCRRDDEESCTSTRTAEVRVDERGRGALVTFDLGDGDLTLPEVEWALGAILQHPEELGIPAGMPISGAVGSYSNSGRLCFRYPHPDHIAIDTALWTVDFGLAFQAAATCVLDPRRETTATVSPEGTAAAFTRTDADQIGTGAHERNYGWLHGSAYPVDRSGQGELFHQQQQFWIRYW